MNRLGHTFLYAGTAVCVLGAVGLVLGMTLTVPEALVWKIVQGVAFAAPLLVGGTLMGCGALLLRLARKQRGSLGEAPAAGQTRPELAAPAAEVTPASAEMRQHASVERTTRTA